MVAGSIAAEKGKGNRVMVAEDDRQPRLHPATKPSHFSKVHTHSDQSLHSIRSHSLRLDLEVPEKSRLSKGRKHRIFKKGINIVSFDFLIRKINH